MDRIDRNKAVMYGFIDNTNISMHKLSECRASDGNSVEAAHINAHGQIFSSWKGLPTMPILLWIDGKARDVRSN